MESRKSKHASNVPQEVHNDHALYNWVLRPQQGSVGEEDPDAYPTFNGAFITQAGVQLGTWKANAGKTSAVVMDMNGNVLGQR